MALKHLLLIGLVAVSTTMITEAVFWGSPNGGVSFNLFGIQVTLYCTLDGKMVDRDTPPFRGADVIFQCGDNNIIFKDITNNFGFSYSFANPESVMPFFPLQSNCNLIVNTTLSTCNSTLPSAGGLQSGIKFVGASLVENLIVANYVPIGYRYNSSI